MDELLCLFLLQRGEAHLRNAYWLVDERRATQY